ncbi:MAG: class II fructose-bisphosphatase [Thermoleophilia bacterium]|nr:class II fructose-bisphosphatase [Thermoleophilia bacterium]
MWSSSSSSSRPPRSTWSRRRRWRAGSRRSSSRRRCALWPANPTSTGTCGRSPTRPHSSRRYVDERVAPPRATSPRRPRRAAVLEGPDGARPDGDRARVGARVRARAPRRRGGAQPAGRGSVARSRRGAGRRTAGRGERQPCDRAAPPLPQPPGARRADRAARRGRDGHRQVDGCNRSRLPAGHHARDLHRLHPPDDARVLLARVHAVDPLLELRGARGRRARRRARGDAARLPRPDAQRARRRQGRHRPRAPGGLVDGDRGGSPRAGDAAADREPCRRAVHRGDRGRTGAPRPLLHPRCVVGGPQAARAVPRAFRRHPRAPGLHRRAGAPKRRARRLECERRRRRRRGHGACARTRRPSTNGVVTQAVEDTVGTEVQRGGACLCETYARVTERAALAGARWLGRADHEAAASSAGRAMREELDIQPIDGHVVIGPSDGLEELAPGQQVGAGGEAVDLAVDPIEGSGIVARGANGAMSMIAVGPRGSLQTLPDMYMRKMAVGPRARGAIDLRRPIADNIQAIAEAFGRRPQDITTIVLDRPRHHDLIEEIRQSGARIKLIQDGDVTASISAAIRGTNDHLAIGIGGTRQAALAAAALRCLGGELQAQLWPTSRSEIEEAAAQGVDDIERVFRIDDLAPADVIVAATGVSNGDLLRGVRYLADSAWTNTLVMCTRCNWVRFVDGIHFFARERREEVRLPGF